MRIFRFTDKLSESASLTGKGAPFRNLFALLECYPASPTVKMVLIIFAERGTHARRPSYHLLPRQGTRGSTAGAHGDLCGRSGGPLASPRTKEPTTLQVRGCVAREGSNPALTFPRATVWGFAPLSRRTRSVEPGVRGQGGAAHSILVPPKSTAASSPGWARLLCGRPEARRAYGPNSVFGQDLLRSAPTWGAVLGASFRLSHLLSRGEH